MINLKSFNFKIVMILGFVIFSNIHLFSLWIINGSGLAYYYSPSSGTEETLKGTTSMDTDIAQGAGYFLEAYVDTLMFMNKVELSPLKGMDYGELQALLDSALKKMTLANATYIHLAKTASYTPYKPEVIDILKYFDYDTFGKVHRCNREIFTLVRAYLSSGNVTGIFNKIKTDTESIISLLTLVKEDVDKGIFPSTVNVRQLNQAFSLSLLFGQYVAEVFEALEK